MANLNQKTFPSIRLRIAMLIYTAVWVFGLPFAVAYVFWRGRKDPLYKQFLLERFGKYQKGFEATLWVHAVSLGETRSATPIIQEFLDKGEKVVITNFTPAGRRASQSLFAHEIANGAVAVAYAPIEFDWAYQKFFKAFHPKIGLVMEIEIWPKMVFSTRKYGLPLYLCNAQYPSHSFERDKKLLAGARSDLIAGYAGVLAKSALQKERFDAFGSLNTVIMGETRFDQEIPKNLLDASKKLKAANTFGDRPIVTLASVVEGEDELYLSLIESIQARVRKEGYPNPLFLYVPRAPERFDAVGQFLRGEGQRVQKRSVLFDENLKLTAEFDSNTDILLCDSLGEMYCFLDLCDACIVGGGFLPSGAHNIIEPLALQKPVFVGPTTWSVEYPAEEAVAAGILVRDDTIEQMAAGIYDRIYHLKDSDDFSMRAKTFFDAHSGAASKALDHLPDMLIQANHPKIGEKIKAMLK